MKSPDFNVRSTMINFKCSLQNSSCEPGQVYINDADNVAKVVVRVGLLINVHILPVTLELFSQR